MTRWTHTLPAVEPTTPQDHAERALIALTWALRAERHPDEARFLLVQVQAAAAHLRAWRKSLPIDQQGERLPSDDSRIRTDRGLIRAAILRVCWADAGDGDQGEHLRAAEARLRVLGKRLAAREES